MIQAPVPCAPRPAPVAAVACAFGRFCAQKGSAGRDRLKILLLIAVVLALAAAATGVYGGLFGVGGEAIPVPVPYEVFDILHAPERQPDPDAARPRYPVELERVALNWFHILQP